LRDRFGAYIRKYSVYSDIVVLDRNGNILARFDETAPSTASDDPLIHAAIETTAGYVESFRESDLIADGKRSLNLFLPCDRSRRRRARRPVPLLPVRA